TGGRVRNYHSTCIIVDTSLPPPMPDRDWTGLYSTPPVVSSSTGPHVRPAPARSDRTPLTREFGLPLYQQIHHLLRHRIATGEYAPGSKIPSESELCRELAVSRVTVREALR